MKEVPLPGAPTHEVLLSDPGAEKAGASDDTTASATGYRSVPYFLSTESHLRLKAAWWATRHLPEGAPTLSSLVERVFEQRIQDLENRHNNGSPFPLAPPRAQGVNSDSARTGGEYRARSYYLPAALHQRMKAAWWATRADPDGFATLSLLVEDIFTATSDELELLYNNGSRFNDAPETARGVSAAAAQRQSEWLRKEWQQRRLHASDEPEQT